jgi:hypothetical protein
MSRDTETSRFLIRYRHCGQIWEQCWSCMCNDRCPRCGAEIEPLEAVDLCTPQPTLVPHQSVRNLTAATCANLRFHKIEAYLVGEHARMGTLPRHFGRRMALVEGAIYGYMREFVKEYTGAYYHFYELSNGGFYAAPQMSSVKFEVPTNGFAGRLSADAAGITACLFAFSHLSFEYPSEEVFSRHFHRLRVFALGHAERQRIFQAID